MEILGADYSYTSSTQEEIYSVTSNVDFNDDYNKNFNNDYNEDYKNIQESLKLDINDYDFDADSLFKEYAKEGWIDAKPVRSEKKVLPVFQYQQLTEKYDLDRSRVIGKIPKNINFFAAIAPNSSNSCYIDSTFELLWDAVLPFVPVDTIDFSKNAFDNFLIRSYKKYSADVVDMEHKKKNTTEASNMIRNFVWEIPSRSDIALSEPQFKKGISNCCKISF